MPDSDSTPQNAEFAAGTLLAGRYEIRRMLGYGAQAVVYLAEEKLLSRETAVKVFRQAVDEKSANRFRQEANLMASLDHPHIVHVYASGVLDDSRQWIAMEYVNGPALHDYLTTEGCLTDEEFIQIFSQLLRALDYLHANSVLHRDLKPENILLARTDNKFFAKLVDFGIAKVFDSDQSNPQTQTKTATVGTAAFMSPEQCQSAAMDARSDLYSLACVMYACYEGKGPFEGSSDFDTMYRQSSAEKAKAVKAPAEINSVIMRALEKNPKDRYQSAKEMLAAIPAIDELSAKPTDNGKSSRHPDKKRLFLSISVFALLSLAGIAFAISTYSEKQRISRETDFSNKNYKRSKTSARNLENEMDREKSEAKKLQIAQRILSDVDPMKDYELRQKAYNHLAQCEHIKGNHDEALSYVKRSLDEALKQKAGNRTCLLLSAAYHQLGLRQRICHYDKEAYESLLKAASTLKRLPQSDRNRWRLAVTLNSLAQSDQDASRFANAETHLREAMKVCQTDPSPDAKGTLCMSNFMMSIALISQNKLTEAQHYIDAFINDPLNQTDASLRYNYPTAIQNIATAFGSKGDTIRALKMLEQAEQKYKEASNKNQILAYAQLRGSQASYFKQLKKPAKAKEKLTEAVAMLEPMQSAICADTLTGLGGEFATLNDYPKAIRTWKLSEQKLKEFDDTTAGAQSMPAGYFLGQYYINTGDTDAAIKHIDEALNFLRTKLPTHRSLIKKAERLMKEAQDKAF